jgi:uncharacterized oxidoreductase
MGISIRIQADALRDFSARLLETAGTPRDIAEVIAQHLVNSDLKGHYTHGVFHIPGYMQRIEKKTLIPDARPEILRETPSTALVDAHNGWGHYAAQWAMNLAMEKARDTGAAAISLARPGHIGRLGEYTEQAAADGFIGIVTVDTGGPGTGCQAAPYGGAVNALGTNPIAVGVPSGDGRHFMADFATTMISGAKIALAQITGAKLSPDSVVDKHGRPTVEVSDYFDGGSMLLFGGYKGYALSLLPCLLGGLTGALGPGGRHMGQCGTFFQTTFLLAVDVRAFQPLEEYKQGVESFLGGIRSIPPAPGFSEVLVPGDPERRTEEEQLRNGIELPQEVWKRLLEYGEKYHVEPGA